MRLLQIFCALLTVLLGFALFVSALLLLGTLAMRAMHKSRAGVLRISHLGGLMLASAFLGFQKIVHPHVPHAIVRQVSEDDDASDEDKRAGGELCLRQLRRIRRGEEVEDLQLVQEARDVPP